MNSTAIATINLQHLQYNLQLIRAYMPSPKIMAMIKSNAYGHGLIPVAKALSSVEAFGVATIDEALQLRTAGIANDIVVMRGFLTRDELAVFFNDARLIACVHDAQQLAILSSLDPETLKNDKLRIWLKIDTGMHRLGFSEFDFLSIYAKLNALAFIEKSFVVCSHLADADNIDIAFTQQQIARFEKITQSISNEKSLLNSAGILVHASAHYDWIRPGLMLYGVSPFQLHDPRMMLTQEQIDLPGSRLNAALRPAMTLTAKLIAIKQVNQGEKIGYSCAFTASHNIKIGIVGMGYGDSYPRQAKNGTPVFIRGERCPIVGRVSMDMIAVDISHLNHVSVDDTVILWGNALSVREIAACANTISHELLCHLTGRVQTVYV